MAKPEPTATTAKSPKRGRGAVLEQRGHVKVSSEIPASLHSRMFAHRLATRETLAHIIAEGIRMYLNAAKRAR